MDLSSIQEQLHHVYVSLDLLREEVYQTLLKAELKSEASLESIYREISVLCLALDFLLIEYRKNLSPSDQD